MLRDLLHCIRAFLIKQVGATKLYSCGEVKLKKQTINGCVQVKKNPVQNKMLKKEPFSHYSSKFKCETRNDN